MILGVDTKPPLTGCWWAARIPQPDGSTLRRVMVLTKNPNGSPESAEIVGEGACTLRGDDPYLAASNLEGPFDTEEAARESLRKRG